MVYNKNAVSAGFDMLTLPKSAVPSKTQSRDEEDSFRSMMDKNVKNAEKDQPKAEQKEETKAPEVKEEAPEQETEGVEAVVQEAAVQAAVQMIVLPEQERAALNWGEAPQEMLADGETAVKAVETVAQEQPVQMQETQTAADNAKTQQVPLEGQQVKAEQPAEQKSVQVQTAGAEKAVQEQPVENKEQPVAVKQETADAKAVVQKEDGFQKQTVVQKQDTAEADVDADTTEMMASAPKEIVSKEAELVQVKVSDKINLTSAQAADDLAETVLVKVAENTNEYELQLAPEELGKIKIKLVIQDGKISVAMSCENQKAADLLAATGGRLKAVIEERTGSEVFVQVEQENPYKDQEKEGQQHNGREQEQQQKKQQEKSPEELADFMQQLRLGLLNLN